MAISLLTQYLKLFADVLCRYPKKNTSLKDGFSCVDKDDSVEIVRQNAIDQTIDFIRAMYGQDFGLKRLAEESFYNGRRSLMGIAKEATITTLVTETPAAPSDIALRHFEERLAFETDCWDVHESLRSSETDFILIDVRGPASLKQAHVPGAVNIPHGKITPASMANYTKDKTFVVYCAGPHCNGANKAAVYLPRIGFPVKMMIGGVDILQPNVRSRKARHGKNQIKQSKWAGDQPTSCQCIKARPGRSAIGAVRTARQRCGQYDWLQQRGRVDIYRCVRTSNR